MNCRRPRAVDAGLTYPTKASSYTLQGVGMYIEIETFGFWETKVVPCLSSIPIPHSFSTDAATRRPLNSFPTLPGFSDMC